MRSAHCYSHGMDPPVHQEQGGLLEGNVSAWACKIAKNLKPDEGGNSLLLPLSLPQIKYSHHELCTVPGGYQHLWAESALHKILLIHNLYIILRTSLFSLTVVLPSSIVHTPFIVGFILPMYLVATRKKTEPKPPVFLASKKAAVPGLLCWNLFVAGQSWRPSRV